MPASGVSRPLPPGSQARLAYRDLPIAARESKKKCNRMQPDAVVEQQLVRPAIAGAAIR
jgi:hypothetical protein